MPSAFEIYMFTMIDKAREEAHRDRSPTVEAQHLLLAIAAEQEPLSAQILNEAGLDHQSIRDALDREFEHSLNSVGVSKNSFALDDYTPDRPSGLGASIRQLIERGFPASRKKDLRPVHLLIGILEAGHGTVPRALELAGVDRAALIARAQEAVR